MYFFGLYLRLTPALHVGRPIIQSAFNVKMIQAGAYDMLRLAPQNRISHDADGTALQKPQHTYKEAEMSLDGNVLGDGNSLENGFPPGNTEASLCSPLFVSHTEIQRLYQQFKDECGMWNFSQDFFLAYVTYSARAARLSAYENQISDERYKDWKKVIEGAVESLELCQISM